MNEHCSITDECPICMENLGVNTALTDCGHTLCNKCFIILIFKSNKCPICRQQMHKSCTDNATHIHNHHAPRHTNCIQRIYNYFSRNYRTVRQDETHPLVPDETPRPLTPHPSFVRSETPRPLTPHPSFVRSDTPRPLLTPHSFGYTSQINGYTNRPYPPYYPHSLYPHPNIHRRIIPF